ncbi:MAG: spore coat protein [Clostridiales bacterium]|jgi:spore coat protein CotF|nr:spore coat protein [Clostridiales bacterium]
MAQNQGLGEKEIASVLLNSHKLGANGLNNLVLESSNSGLRQDVTQILYHTYQHQKLIWDFMNNKGYYQVEYAPQQEIAKATQQLQQQQSGMQ